MRSAARLIPHTHKTEAAANGRYMRRSAPTSVLTGSKLEVGASNKIAAMKKAGLVDSPVRCKYGVTEAGKKALS